MAKLTRAAAYLVVCTMVILFVVELTNKVNQEPGYEPEQPPKIEFVSNVNTNEEKAPTLRSTPNNTIRIASVVCSRPGEDGPRTETALMIKSVIISTVMYEVTKNIEFHLFLEHKEDKEYFLAKLKEYGDSFDHIEIDVMFYSAIDAFPKQYRKKLLFVGQFRCMYVRIFFPYLLPRTDSVLYVDTDVIITGNIENVWSHFSKMNREQLIAVAGNVEPDNPRESIFFNDIPYPKPKGLNSGVLLMNLTRMKEHHWTEKLLRIYSYYKRKGSYMNDQKLINVLLYYEPELLLPLPCQFNFWMAACYEGFYCDGAVSDPNGIQVIHGANSSLEENKPFYDIRRHYDQLQLSQSVTINSLKSNLMQPIRKDYTVSSSWTEEQRNQSFLKHRKCDGSISQLLFRKYFPFENINIVHGNTSHVT